MQVLYPAILYAVFVVYTFCACNLAMPTEQVQCRLGGEVFNVNDTWHPTVNGQGGGNCVNCTCLPNGSVSCERVMSCPTPDCDEPRHVQGHCCPTCDVKDDDSIGSSHKKNVSRGRDCWHEGRSYSHLDVFPNNNTALQPKNDSQCVMCNCFDGKVMCVLQLCLPNPKCKKLVSVSDDCCKKCQEEPGRTDRTSSRRSRRKRPKKLSRGACWWHRARKENGTTWNPVVAGQQSCVTCTCLNNDVTCDRNNCPKDIVQSCADENHDFVCDCEACPLGLTKDDKKEKGKKKNKKGTTEKKKKKKHKRRHCGKGKKGDTKSRRKCRDKKRGKKKKEKQEDVTSSLTSSIFLPEMLINDVINKLCIPKRADYVMYHVQGDKFESVVFDGPDKSSIQDIRWKVRKGRLRGDHESHVVLGLVDFRSKVKVADVIGAVKENQIKRFIKMVNRRKRRCKKPCRRKLVSRLLKKLKYTEIDFSKTCEE